MTPDRSVLSLPLPKATIASLTMAGYDTLKDLSTATVEGLVRDLHVSHEVAEQILAMRAPCATIPSTIPTTQSAATLAQVSPKVATGCEALDNLLQGGIQRGHILELSGPPGTPKEIVVMNLIEHFASNGDQVLVADCQNMIDRRVLRELSRRARGNASIRYTKPQTLAQLMLFLEQLPILMGTSSKETCLVLSSMSTLFQSTELTPASRTALLQKLKQAFAKFTVNHRLSMVITGQLATKLLNSDGSPGTFDTGAQGIMVPQLGSTYLPSGKSWRVIFSPYSQISGHIKLLSSPHSEVGRSEAQAYTVRRVWTSPGDI